MPSPYIGYHSDSDLPIKPGDIVTILKGTPIRNRGKTKTAGRTYKVRVNHLLPGCTDRSFSSEAPVHKSNPMVRWAGTGGYWSEVDINLVPEAVDATPTFTASDCDFSTHPGDLWTLEDLDTSGGIWEPADIARVAAMAVGERLFVEANDLTVLRLW